MLAVFLTALLPTISILSLLVQVIGSLYSNSVFVFGLEIGFLLGILLSVAISYKEQGFYGSLVVTVPWLILVLLWQKEARVDELDASLNAYFLGLFALGLTDFYLSDPCTLGKNKE